VPTQERERAFPAEVDPFQIANLGSGDIGLTGTVGSIASSLGVVGATPAVEATIDAPAPKTRPAERPFEKIQWRESEAHGVAFGGHLHDGVALPIRGPNWITWDPTHDRVPNRAWRLHGTDKLIRMIVNISKAHHVAFPAAPPLLIGDISATEGGPLDHHHSHQNGLDVDIYYPREDGKPTEPTSPSQIDVALTQDLVDRFVKAGAQFVFVGYQTGVSGPGGIVQPYPNHENHMHVRIYP
jgi:murein endopeptidase